MAVEEGVIVEAIDKEITTVVEIVVLIVVALVVLELNANVEVA